MVSELFIYFPVILLGTTGHRGSQDLEVKDVLKGREIISLPVIALSMESSLEKLKT